MKKVKFGIVKGEDYYALLCNSYEDYLICGVFGTRKEANIAGKEIKDCPAKHFIKKCDITITLCNHQKY